MPLRFPARVKAQTSTTGTGPFTVTEPGQAGYRTFTQAVTDGDLSDGDSTPVLIIDTNVTNGPNLFQFATATWGNTTKTLTIVENHQPAVPPNWGAGTRDVLVVADPLLFLLLSENLADLPDVSAAVANLGLNDRPLKISSGQSGGTTGKFVRISSANTWMDASQTDTIDQLALVLFKEATGLYVVSGLITSSGFTTGAPLYLLTSGGWTHTVPTPSSTVRRRLLGVAISTTKAIIWQAPTIGGE